MFLWPRLSGTQLSPVDPRSCVLPSGAAQGNCHDWRAKQGEGLRCCVSPHPVCLTCHLPPLKKSYGWADSNPVVVPG
ncbi:unnamed protein product [Schistocephalus solidus]|uniref:Secreted protein n=1 Tax=Schistocephalus solidus TaxID=70667 RepID=A0A183SSY3_SCHSO|nr:unnamed protein product [Schistocephalus solidus]